eukprot:scaffold24385_cov101-Isochrysis_galbana.AAC.1
MEMCPERMEESAAEAWSAVAGSSAATRPDAKMASSVSYPKKSTCGNASDSRAQPRAPLAGRSNRGIQLSQPPSRPILPLAPVASAPPASLSL